MSTSVPPPGMGSPAPALEPGNAPPPAAPSRSRARWLAGACGLAVAVVLGFVLLGSSSTPLTDPVAQAATLSSSSPGYKVRMVLELSSPTLSVPITAVANGAVDTPDHAGMLSMSMNFSQPQISQALGTSTLSFEIVTRGHAIYMKMPSALAAKVPLFTKPWLKVDLSKLSGIPGLSSLDSNPAGTDPSQMMQYLRAISDSVASEGFQTVAGIPTRHYRAELDLDRVAGALPQADRSGAEQAITAIEKTTGLHSFPVDVWIDAHHLVRRIAMSIALGVPGSGSLSETMVMDFSDYGPQPEPALPPAGQVQDLSGAVGGAASSGTL